MGITPTISGKNQPESTERKILNLATTLRVKEHRSSGEIWNQLNNQLDVKKDRKIVPLHFNTMLRVAASVALLVVSLFALYYFNEVTVQTPYASHKTITLPDGSVVDLNADSEIRYNKALWLISRKVFFTGEGFFTVSKGEKFEVISPNGVTQVLGTQFNLISRKSVYRVSCLEGKVRVTNPKQSSQVILTPGKETSLEKNVLTERLMQEHVTAWKQGEFYFDNTLLSDVLTTLELQYNIKIHTTEKGRYYTGYFTNQNLEEAIKLVCVPLNLKYEFTNNNILKISTQK